VGWRAGGAGRGRTLLRPSDLTAAAPAGPHHRRAGSHLPTRTNPQRIPPRQCVTRSRLRQVMPPGLRVAGSSAADGHIQGGGQTARGQHPLSDRQHRRTVDGARESPIPAPVQICRNGRRSALTEVPPRPTGPSHLPRS
jgi:hypothetical protein